VMRASVASSSNVIGLLCSRDAAVDSATVIGGELLGKDVANESDRLVQPKCCFGVTHVEDTTVASCLEAGTEIPEIEARLSLALLQFLRNERRSSVLEFCRALKIDALADRCRLDDEPAFVEPPSRYRD